MTGLGQKMDGGVFHWDVEYRRKSRLWGIKMVSSVWDTLNIWDVCEWLGLWFCLGIADLAYSIPYLLVEVMGMDKLPEREKGTYFLINHFAF